MLGPFLFTSLLGPLDFLSPPGGRCMFFRSLLLVPFLTQGKVMETRFLRGCPLRNEIVYYLDHTWIAINLCLKKPVLFVQL